MRLLLATLVLAACGSNQVASAPRVDAGADADDGGACALEPTGSFTFHVHNAGTNKILVDRCGVSAPILLATPAGRLPANPSAVDGFTCDQVYSGQLSSDFDGGAPQPIAPGATADITWDRRVYARHTAAAACARKPQTCAFGFAVAPSATQLGILTTCPADQSPLTLVSTEFTLDTTMPEGTIEVGR